MNVDRNEFFRQATVRICGSLDIGKAMRLCFEYLANFLPLRSMHLRLYDPDLNVVETIASVTPDDEEDPGRVFPMPEEHRDKWASDWDTMERIEINNRPYSDPKIMDLLRRMGREPDFSMMRMRLELEGKRVGVLDASADGNDRYTDDHARLLLLLHEPFAIAMANALEHQEVHRLKDMLADDNRYLQQQLQELSGEEIIGADFGLREIMNMVRQVAPLDSPVLLMGETGVGKEVIANAIHQSSPRRDGPLIKVNCGAIPENLLDSELFGHEKGSFTGAITQKRGRFERADQGTIFLDEIGELPPQAQVRLLNVLQNREIERVGGTKSIPVDIRILSATHRNLEEMIRSGQFREDLWFRLNVFPIMIPPLRQRREDIPALIHYFLGRKSAELKLMERPALANGAMERLMAYAWPGNVRELANVVERALIQHRGGLLSFEGHLGPTAPRVSDSHRGVEPDHDLVPLEEMNARHIRQALELAHGKISGPGGAAEMLSVHPNTLRKRMDKLGISYGRKKSATRSGS